MLLWSYSPSWFWEKVLVKWPKLAWSSWSSTILSQPPSRQYSWHAPSHLAHFDKINHLFSHQIPIWSVRLPAGVEPSSLGKWWHSVRGTGCYVSLSLNYPWLISLHHGYSISQRHRQLLLSPDNSPWLIMDWKGRHHLKWLVPESPLGIILLDTESFTSNDSICF